MEEKNTHIKAKNWKKTDIDEIYPKVFRFGMKTIIKLKIARKKAMEDLGMHLMFSNSFPQKV
jgi:hypothetical protein